MNFVGFELQAPKCELKGTQMCNLLNANGEEPKVIMAECVCLFEPSAFGWAADASRVSLSLVLNEPNRATTEEIEGFLLKEAQRLQLFGGADEDELKSSRPLLASSPTCGSKCASPGAGRCGYGALTGGPERHHQNGKGATSK
jgi:hypothetical protein